jgi:hypothetical protein
LRAIEADRSRHGPFEMTVLVFWCIWAAEAADVVREPRGLPVPFDARLNLITLIAGIPGLEDEAAIRAACFGAARSFSRPVRREPEPRRPTMV